MRAARLTPPVRRRLALVLGLAVAAAMVLAPVAASGWFDAGIAAVVEAQRELHRELARALALVREHGPQAAWPLIGLAFAYGVFHAAGPGHGKVVMTTYLATQEGRLARGLALTAAAALAQALTAIVAVHVLTVVLDRSLRQARGGAAELELVSFALVAVLGCYLTARATRRLGRDHAAGPAHACANCAASRHVATGPWSAVGVVAAIGARPCAGAVVVLLLAYAADLRLVGIAATLAMAMGTALTTGALAVLAITARRTVGRVAAALPGEHARAARLADGAALVGGLALLGLGAVLFEAAWSAPAHPFR